MRNSRRFVGMGCFIAGRAAQARDDTMRKWGEVWVCLGCLGLFFEAAGKRHQAEVWLRKSLNVILLDWALGFVLRKKASGRRQ